MTEQDLKNLIAKGESLSAEFKGDAARRLTDEEIFENVVCLANGQGGTLLIGVENDGQVTGLHPDRLRRPLDPHLLQAAIFNHTAPPINSRVNVVQLEDRWVASIQVDAYPVVCATSSGKCFRRGMGSHGPECQPYYPYQHQSRSLALGLEDLTARTLEGARWSQLDPLEFERLRRMIERSSGDRRLLGLSDRELAMALRLVETTHEEDPTPNVAGLLLLGKEGDLQRLIPTHKTIFQAFSADGSPSANDPLRAPLLRQVEELEARYEARKDEQEILIGMLRVAIPAYSKDAFREAINNALVHRDYSRMDAIYIQWHADYLVITSPGSFPSGVTPQNLLTHEPKPRNPRLAEACVRIGLVESTARGVDSIYRGQLRFGRPLPDYSRSDDTAVRLILRGGQTNLAFIKLATEVAAEGRPLSLDELIALSQFQVERRLNVTQLAPIIQKGETDARRALEQLVERGLLEARGQKHRQYMLSAEIYRALGLPADYVRQRGFSPIQREAMIEDFVRAHGQITRSQVVELCRTTDEEAVVILRRMAGSGRLRLQGERRGAYYVLGERTEGTPLSGKALLAKIIVLLQQRAEMSLQEIEDALRQEGFEVAGHNKRNYLTSLMSRNKALFEGLGKGFYRLNISSPD